MTRHRIALALCLLLPGVPVLAHGAQDIDRVNGSITAQAGQTYGALETVNGSIRLEDGATTQAVETVNGGIRAGDGIHARSLTTVNGAIRIGDQAVVERGVETVNGEIFVDRGGRIGGDVDTVNGAIGLVASEVGGNVTTVHGDITVGAGSHVRGGLRVEKPSHQWLSLGKRQPPRIIIGPNARVDGPLVFEREVKLYVHRTATIGAVTGATAVRYDGDRAPAD